MTAKFKRILLKLSGEALMGDQQFGVDPVVATRIARDVLLKARKDRGSRSGGDISLRLRATTTWDSPTIRAFRRLQKRRSMNSA